MEWNGKMDTSALPKSPLLVLRHILIYRVQRLLQATQVLLRNDRALTPRQNPGLGRWFRHLPFSRSLLLTFETRLLL